MMILVLVLGVGLLLGGLVIFVVKLGVSFTSEGGAEGGMPILDAAFFGPTFCWIGIAVLDRRCVGWPGWPVWGYLLAWLLSVLLAGYALYKVGRFGEYWHQRGKPPD